MKLLRTAAVLVLLILAAPWAAFAQTTTWVHATDPTCGGNSPCFATLSLGIENVADGGTVIVMASAVDKINNTHGKQNVTVRGVDDTIQLTGNVNLQADDPAVGWTLQDLNFTLGIVIRTIAGSITVDNVGAAALRIGPLTQDTTADILIRGVTMQQGIGALISVIAENGADLGGSITIENCVGIYAININADIGPANPAVITSNIQILGNDVFKGGGVNVRGIDFSGNGSITGPVVFSGNNMSDLEGKFGVTLFGNVTGEISGPVTFDDNRGGWLAVLTTSTPDGSIGELNLTHNTVEALEVVATGALGGPIQVLGNSILDLGGGTQLDNPLLLLDGSPLSGSLVVENNLGPQADMVARSSAGALTGAVQLLGNTAAVLTLDSRDGDITQPFTVSGNTLPAAAAPQSTLTLRSLNGGDTAGGTVSGNRTDRLTLSFAGQLTGGLSTTGNVVRDVATLWATGGPGPGIHTVTGNDFRGESSFNGMHATVRFNRMGDRMSVVAGATVDGRYNWWGCNAGPNQPGCSTATNNVFQLTPHLTFRSDLVSCAPPSLPVGFDLLAASDGAQPAGNVTPGTVTVTTSAGTVSGSPATLGGGSGSASVALPMGASQATITTQLDNESVVLGWPCASQIFADGFESGDTSAWGQIASAVCGCRDTATAEAFTRCLDDTAAAAPGAPVSARSFTRDQLETFCAED
jgi:hypothetical protein